ncbi:MULTISPECIES: hypothetical protein [unclassified Psychrobacillus]|uniref:hypothetical protein n=1 Tax=unclassified Psychrobacillus TaxID=2636677 RepID=UPI0030FB07D6
MLTLKTNDVSVKTYEEEYNYFLSAILGKVEYCSYHNSIQKVEKFLIYWLNGEVLDDILIHLQTMYKTFQHLFPYKGTIYRGVEIESFVVETNGLRNKYLTSFTNQEEVARYFAGVSTIYGNSQRESMSHYLIEMNTSDCFSFDEFLMRILELTHNVDLEIVIEERNWENEKIAFFDQENCKLTKV